jgi:hypothetical protein
MVGEGIARSPTNQKSGDEATGADPPAAPLGPGHDGPQLVWAGLGFVVSGAQQILGFHIRTNP